MIKVFVIKGLSAIFLGYQNSFYIIYDTV